MILDDLYKIKNKDNRVSLSVFVIRKPVFLTLANGSLASETKRTDDYIRRLAPLQQAFPW